MNFIKYIYSHTFDNPLTLANTVFITIAIAITLLAILLEFFALNKDYFDKIICYIKCFKSLRDAYYNTIDIFKYLGEQLFICIYAYVIIFLISLFSFIVSTIWVEYPLNGVIYTKNDNVWTRHDGRVWHAPFGFDGYKIQPKKILDEIVFGDVFKIKYHVDENSIPQVLNYLTRDSYLFRDNINDLIETKFKILVFFVDHKSLLNPEIRLKVFQDFYSPYGITIDSVDML